MGHYTCLNSAAVAHNAFTAAPLPLLHQASIHIVVSSVDLILINGFQLL